MESSIKSFKGLMPIFVKNASAFFEIHLTIKLFGVTVFSFTWPPKESENPNNNE